MSKQYDVAYSGINKYIPEFLKEICQKEKEALSIYGHGMEAGEFKVNNVRINSIDNFECKINYDGGYFGSNDASHFG